MSSTPDHLPAAGHGLTPLPNAAVRRAAERWPDHLLRTAVDFLPLILLGLLALATTWLVRSMPGEQVARPPPPANEPDYYMRNFQVRDYAAGGVLKTELAGTYAEHFPAGDMLQVQQLQGYGRDLATGVETRVWAGRAVSDRQLRNAELFEHAKLLRTDPQPDAQGQPKPPLQFESNYLRIVNRQEHVLTDQPVRITQGNDVMTGAGLDYTGNTKVVQVQGRIKAVIQPRP